MSAFFENVLYYLLSVSVEYLTKTDVMLDLFNTFCCPVRFVHITRNQNDVKNQIHNDTYVGLNRGGYKLVDLNMSSMI